MTQSFPAPKVEGTRPPQFAADLKRAVAGLEGIAAAGPSTLDPGTDSLAACRWLTGYVGRTNIPSIICCSSVCRSGAIEPDA